MKKFLTGKVFWSYDHEVSQRSPAHNILAHFSGVLPFHRHKGVIYLTDRGLLISGDENLQIPYPDFDQVYLGFDKVYPRTLSRNLGLSWQPLRIKFDNGFEYKTVYLIIDHNLFGNRNQLWFNSLKGILSVPS